MYMDEITTSTITAIVMHIHASTIDVPQRSLFLDGRQESIREELQSFNRIVTT